MTLSVDQQKPILQQKELLLEIEEQGTPLRLDGKQETYYVLSASQLRILMGRLMDDVTNIEEVTGFTLEDFGLTEADLTEYNEAQQSQRKRVSMAELKPLSKELSEQLSQVPQSKLSSDAANATAKETLLRELESAILANLQAAASAA